MQIAIIGWGSLLWDLEVLEPHVVPEWQRAAGPSLPLEFSRVSPKRLRALALIIDPDHGTECQTSLVNSRRDRLEDTVSDLAARERAPLDRIGFASKNGAWQSTIPGIEGNVGTWLISSGYDGAVWTDLPANFRDETGAQFSIHRAISYLKTLNGNALLEAKRYIELAPEESMTALRQALGEDPWWKDVPLKPDWDADGNAA